MSSKPSTAFRINRRATEYQIFDGEIPGLALRVNPSGKKVYALFYRTSTGRKRTLTLGLHGAITAEQARKLAKERLADVTHGEDPAAERQRVRHAPDMAALAERYRREHLAFKKPSTRARADGLLKRIILPAFGRMKAEAVTRADVLALHRAHRATPVEANRAITLLSSIFTWAEDEGLMLPQGNPCSRVKKHAERLRERYLSAQELARVGAALAGAEHNATEPPTAILAIRLLLLGCRPAPYRVPRHSPICIASQAKIIYAAQINSNDVPVDVFELRIHPGRDGSAAVRPALSEPVEGLD